MINRGAKSEQRQFLGPRKTIEIPQILARVI